MSLHLRRPLLWSALGELLPRTVGFGITVFIANRLGPRGFGVFSLAYSWVNVCWGVVDLGTSNYALRVLAEDPRRRRRNLSEIFVLNVLLAMVTGAVAATIVALLVRDAGLKTTTLVMLIFLVTFAAYPDWYLRGTAALRELALANAAIAGAWLAGTIALQATPQPAGFGLAWALSPVAAALVFWTVAPHPSLNLRYGLRPRAWLFHLRTSALFAVSGAISNATIPAMMSFFGLLSGFETLGSYALGLRLGMMAASAVWIVFQNLTAQLVEYREQIRPVRLIGGTFLVGLFGFGALAITSQSLLVPFMGKTYGPGVFWTLLGAAAIIPWSAKLPVEALLIVNRLDMTRISIQVVSLAGVLLAGASAWLLHVSIILPIGYLVSELTGAALGWILIERHRRDAVVANSR